MSIIVTLLVAAGFVGFVLYRKNKKTNNTGSDNYNNSDWTNNNDRNP